VGSTGASSGNETGALSHAALNSSIGNGHSTAKFLSVPSRNWANSGSISERRLYLGFGCATAALLGFSWIIFSLSECIPAARGLSRVSPMCIAKEALHKSTRDHGSAPIFVKLQPRVLHPKPPNVSTTVCGVNQNAEAHRSSFECSLGSVSFILAYMPTKTISTAHRSKDMGDRSSEPGANRWPGTRPQVDRCCLSGRGNRRPTSPCDSCEIGGSGQILAALWTWTIMSFGGERL
jgi:hypothetical protein